MTETTGVQQIECQKQSSDRRGEFGGQQCQKLQKDPAKEQKWCHCPERMEYHLQYLTKQSQCCVLLDRLTEKGC